MIAKYTFENLKPLPALLPSINAVKGVIAGVKPFAFIYGNTGNGKTHLLEAAAGEFNKRHRVARVIAFQKVLSTLKDSINQPVSQYETILAAYCEADVLLMDDIGAAGSNSDFGFRILEDIVCARYARERTAILVSNIDITQLPDRITSRLNDKSLCYLVLNQAEDYRKRKGGK